MTDRQSTPTATGSVVTTKDTVATYKLADMRRVFQYIEADDLLALDKLMFSGRAFHLPKGVEVFVLDFETTEKGMCQLRIKGSITEIWASVSAVAEPEG